MLEQVLDYIHNYFIRDEYSGRYVISGGVLTGVDFLIDGQYYKIEGSLLNDGVHKHPDSSLTDEEFIGKICSMAVPVSVVAIADEISDWEEKYGNVVNGPYNSESFGGYAYTKANGGSNGRSGDNTGWRGVFGSRLNHWRKVV